MHLPSYGGGYWGRYPYWHWGWHTHNVNWWRWASVPLISQWCFVDNTEPNYYVYGDNVYYEGDSVYVGDEVVATAQEYADQAREIASAVPEDVDPAAVEWLPLGVFALTETDGSAEDATLFLQLAISKEGIIAGSFQNTATDEAFEVEGTIDRESQRAAWGPVGKEWPIMETGIFNLSESQTDALLHFDQTQTQQWTMSRLEDSGADTP